MKEVNVHPIVAILLLAWILLVPIYCIVKMNRTEVRQIQAIDKSNFIDSLHVQIAGRIILQLEALRTEEDYIEDDYPKLTPQQIPEDGGWERYMPPHELPDTLDKWFKEG